MTPQPTPARPKLLLATLVIVAVMLVQLGILHADMIDQRLLLVNDNTLRDFEVYGRLRHGLVPLQGPITSVGGNHGWLAGPLYGLAVWAWPSLNALYATSMGLVLLGVVASFALAWRVAPGAPALLGTSLLFATHMTLLTYFPSHIALLLLGVPLAYLGVALTPTHRWGPVLATTGLAIAIGGHRIGWALLAGFIVGEVVFRLGVLRRPVAWVPLALYALPHVAVFLLGGSPTPVTSEATTDWLAGFDPWTVARLMPFVQLPIRPFNALQAAQMLLVVVTLRLAWPGLATPAARFVGWSYLVMAVGLLVIRYDGQYYMPMLTLLPTLVAVATQQAFAHSPRRITLYAGFVLVLGLWSNVDVVTASFSGTNLSDLMKSSVSDQEALLEVLRDEGLTSEELWQTTRYLPDEARAPIGYLAAALLPLPEGGPPERCVQVARAADVPAGQGWRTVGRTLALKIDGTTPCDGNVRPYDSPIWYLNLHTLGFEAR